MYCIRHIQNFVIFSTVFLHICQHIQSNLALLRPIHTYRNIIKAYSVLFYSVLKYKILQLDPLPDTNPSSAQETDIFVKPNNQITA